MQHFREGQNRLPWSLDCSVSRLTILHMVLSLASKSGEIQMRGKYDEQRDWETIIWSLLKYTDLLTPRIKAEERLNGPLENLGLCYSPPSVLDQRHREKKDLLYQHGLNKWNLTSKMIQKCTVSKRSGWIYEPSIYPWLIRETRAIWDTSQKIWYPLFPWWP